MGEIPLPISDTGLEHTYYICADVDHGSDESALRIFSELSRNPSNFIAQGIIGIGAFNDLQYQYLVELVIGILNNSGVRAGVTVDTLTQNAIGIATGGNGVLVNQMNQISQVTIQGIFPKKI